MIILNNETRSGEVKNKTLDGFLVNVRLKANNSASLIPPTGYATATGFDASQITIKVILKRNGRSWTQISDNLGILGQYNSILKGAKEWNLGTDFALPPNKPHEVTRSVFISLGGHHQIKGDDVMSYEVTVGRNTFNTGLSVNDCSVEINPHYSIGKELGIFMTKSEVIDANKTREQFNLGDNVMKLAILNFEDTDYTKQIISNLQLSSDRVDWTFTLNDLICVHMMKYGDSRWLKPYDYQNGVSNAMDSYLPAFPNSFVVLDNEEVDQATLDINFVPNSVVASLNHVVYTCFASSQEIIAKALHQTDKHNAENISKLPITL